MNEKLKLPFGKSVPNSFSLYQLNIVRRISNIGVVGYNFISQAGCPPDNPNQNCNKFMYYFDKICHINYFCTNRFLSKRLDVKKGRLLPMQTTLNSLRSHSIFLVEVTHTQSSTNVGAGEDPNLSSDVSSIPNIINCFCCCFLF